MIAADKNVVACEGTGSKAGVTGKNDLVLLKGDAQNSVVIERWIVQNIEAKQPEALRETAQHCIGDELHG